MRTDGRRRDSHREARLSWALRRHPFGALSLMPAPLMLISSAFTPAAWLLVPLVPIDAIQAAAQESARSSRSTASLADS